MADTDLVPDDGITAGSRTTPINVPEMRRAAATARELLTALACPPVEGRCRDARGARRRDHGPGGTDDDVRRPGEGQGSGGSPRPGDPPGRGAHAGAGVEDPGPVRARGRTLATSSPGRTGSPPTSCARECCTAGSCAPLRTGRPSNRSTSRRSKATKDVVAVRDGPFVGFAAPSSHRATQALEAAARTASWKTSPPPVSNENLFEHLARARAPERGASRREGLDGDGLAAGGSGPHGVLPRRLHPARPDGATRRRGRVERGPPHGLGRVRRALPRAADPVGGARHPAGAGPRDRARHGRRVRRQAHRRGRRRGGPPRPRRREARLGPVDPRRGVHVGLLPPGGRHRVPRRLERQGRARRLGVHQHQPRRRGHRHALRHPEREDRLGGHGLPPAPGFLSVPRGHRQQLRPGVLHGRAGGGRRGRSARVPAGPPGEPAASRRAREGGEGVRLGRAEEEG